MTISNITLPQGEEAFYEIDIPDRATNVTFTMAGGTGDADLYVQYNALPTDTLWQCRPFSFGNNEVCSFDNPAQGKWFARIKAFSAASGVSLTATFTVRSVDAPDDLAASIVFPLKRHATRVPLSWTGGTAPRVDILFNGFVVANVLNTGRFTHTFTRRGSGTVTYQVCNANTVDCSKEIRVAYTSRP